MAIVNWLNKILKRREFFIIIVVALLFIVMAFVNPIFISLANLHALFLGISVEAIVSIGMTILLICGMLDLSVGGNMALSAGLSCLLMLKGFPIGLCILVAVLIGSAVGVFNGFFVAYFNIPPFVMTLATMNICRGLLTAVTQAQALTGLPQEFTIIGQGYLIGIQYPIYFGLFLLVIAHFLMTKARFFRQCYYIGGNEKAARNSGINIEKTKFIFFVMTGALCGVAAFITAARYGTTNVNLATGIELRIITAVVVGGASMNGGSGTIIGTLFGTILMAAISNIIVLQGADIYWQTFITGATLFVAVVLDQLNMANKKRKDIKTAEALFKKYMHEGQESKQV